jgi:hypothetical protein
MDFIPLASINIRKSSGKVTVKISSSKGNLKRLQTRLHNVTLISAEPSSTYSCMGIQGFRDRGVNCVQQAFGRLYKCGFANIIIKFCVVKLTHRKLRKSIYTFK